MLKNPSREETERKVFSSDEEIMAFLHALFALPNSREKLAFGVIAFTGMRRSEMLGLKWEDIDWDKQVIHIRRAVKHVHNQPDMEDLTTKTKNGVRDIYFGDELKSLLEPMRSTGYLLGGKKPLSDTEYTTVRKHFFSKVDTHGVTEHGIRHSVITLLEHQGTDLKTLQTFAGHADSHTTMQVYVHSSAAKLEEAGRKMNDYLHNLAEKTRDYAAQKVDLDANQHEKTA